MSEPVSINPDGLRNAANQFDDISDTTRQILNTLTGGASAEGEPWGDDKPGKKFSEGSQGYLANRDGTFKSLDQLVGLFGQNRDNLRDSAKTFEQNENQVTNSTPSGSGNAPSGSGSGSSANSSSYAPLQPRLYASRMQLQQPRQYADATPEQPLQPFSRIQETPAEQPRQAVEGQSIPGTPLQPFNRIQQVSAEQPRQYADATPEQPLQPFDRIQQVRAEQPRQVVEGQSIPATPLQPFDRIQQVPAEQPRQAVERSIPETPVQPFDRIQEPLVQPLQPREYDREIPATEGEPVRATPEETFRTSEEQPLQREQAFPRVQAQPVQNPNQT